MNKININIKIINKKHLNINKLKYILIVSFIINIIDDYYFFQLNYFPKYLGRKYTLKIFIMAHKDFENFRYNPVYSIVVDDKSLLKNKYNLDIIYADKGKLYNLKRAYSEISQLYYIYSLYKHGTITSDYIGLNHYRRYFKFKDSIPDIDEIFKNYDVILDSPYFMKNGMRSQFCECHICQNYDQVLEIIKDIRPEYYQAALEANNIKYINFCNLFIMKKNDFLNYCKFMFDILFEFDRRNNFTSDDDVLNYVSKFYNINKTKNNETVIYQSRLQAFLSERIGNIYYYKNFKRKKIISFGNFRNHKKPKRVELNKNDISKYDYKKFMLKLIIKKISLIILAIITIITFKRALISVYLSKPIKSYKFKK